MSDQYSYGVKAGTTDFTCYVIVRSTTDNTEVTGKVYTDVTGSYVRTRGTRTAITMATLAAADSAHSDGGFKEVDATNMPGIYRFDVPDAVLASGVDTAIVTLKISGAYIVPLEFHIVSATPQDNNALLTNGSYGLAQLVRSTTPANTLSVDASNRVTVGTNADKTGYSLTQSFPTNFSSLAIDGSGQVTVGTNADKTGYSLSQAFPSNFADLAITSTTGRVTVGTNADKTGYSVGSGGITSASFAADSITASAVAADVGTEIGTAVWATGTRTITGLTAAALADFFDTDSGTTYASAVSGSVVKEIADNAATSALTAGDIADAVLDEALSGHTTSGTLGKAITDIETNVSAILTDTGTTLDGKLNTLTSRIPDTLSLANINAEADTALADYDAPTKSELDAGFAALNNISEAQVNAQVDQALADINLDHLMKIAVDTNFATTVHLDSVIGHLVDTGTSATFDRTTDSTEAIRNRGDAAWTTATGFSTFDHTSDQVTVGTNNDKTGYSISGTKTTLDALNDVSAATVNAQCDSALSDYDAPTNTEMVAAFTEIKGATFSGSTDSLEAIRNRGDAAWITATGFSTHSASDVWSSGTRTITGLTAAALANLFDTDSMTTYSSAVSGSVVKEIADNATGGGGVQDWTSNERAQIRDALGIDGSKTAATGGDLQDIATNVSAILDDTGTSGVVIADKTGFALSSAGVNAVADQVWDEATSGHTTSGTFGEQLKTDVDAILADTDSLDTTKLTSSRATALDNLDVAISTRSTITQAEVNAQCDTALADYDAPTKTEMDAAFTQIKGATWTTTDTLEAIRDRGDAAWTTATGFSTFNAASDTVTLADSGLTAAKIATDAGNKIADHVIRRSFANAEDSSNGDTKTFRSLLGAGAKLVNKVSTSGSTLTVCETDDTTALGTQTITSDSNADPITALDTD